VMSGGGGVATSECGIGGMSLGRHPLPGCRR
jgi:hypothetical protein